MELTVQTTEPVGVKIITGLHVGWVTGSDDDGTTFELSSGTGVGNPNVMLRVELPDGTTVHDHFDVRPLVEQWVNKLRDAHAESVSTS